LSVAAPPDPGNSEENQRVRPLLNSLVRAACIFTAGSRELLGSRVARKTAGHRQNMAMPFFIAEC
jgi:hypothetical protein